MSSQSTKMDSNRTENVKTEENDKKTDVLMKFSDIEKVFKSQNRKIIVISDKIYDITNFMFEHPGGADVLDFYVFKDATNAFYEIGHSSDAEELLKKFLIGELE